MIGRLSAPLHQSRVFDLSKLITQISVAMVSISGTVTFAELAARLGKVLPFDMCQPCSGDNACVITDDDNRRAVTRNAFDAGLFYQLDGQVHDLRVGGDGHWIDATVEGTGRKLYRQSVRLAPGARNTMLVSGSCTCPVGRRRKHIAAMLFEYQEQTAFGKNAESTRADQPVTQFEMPPQPAVTTRAAMLAAAPADVRLPFEVDAWLRSLDAAQHEEAEAYPPTLRKRPLYVIDRAPRTGGLLVGLKSIDLRRDDTPGGTFKRHLADKLLWNGQQPKYLHPSDHALLRALNHHFPGDGQDLTSLVQRIIATGRGPWAE